jgi:shikimate kinase
MKALYITGFMGSGKTTIGRALSERWNMPVIDTDEQVEERTEKKIRDIFAQEGEAAFRKYETEVLKSLPVENVIITTGGGIIGKEENRSWMQGNGTVLYLYCDPEYIVKRLQGDTTRPLFQETESFFALFRSRQSLYEEAHCTVDTTHKDIEAVLDEIEAKIKCK